MIEWFIILGIILCIVVWYYSQTVSQYSLSQIKESQSQTQLATLWQEKKPIVISEVRESEIWSADSLSQTRFWSAQPIWAQYQADPVTTVIVDNKPQQMTWSDMLGISQLESDLLLKWYDVTPWVYSIRTEAHIGHEGLRQAYGYATAYHVTDGEGRAILLHNAQKSKMPPGWLGLRWNEANGVHHPLWNQVQNIEVILRPGTVLLIPSHWIVAIEPLDPSKPLWWTRSDVHHPISSWAQRWNEHVP